MEVRSHEKVNCPHCGILNPATENTCQRCLKRLTIYIGPASSLPRRLGLGTLMTLVAVMAIGFGLFRIVPALGVLFLYLFTPATIRTLGVISQRDVDNQPLTAKEQVYVFFSSLELMIATLLGFFITFLLVTFPVSSFVVNSNGYGYVLILLVSSSFGLVVVCLIFHRFWHYRG